MKEDCSADPCDRARRASRWTESGNESESDNETRKKKKRKESRCHHERKNGLNENRRRRRKRSGKKWRRRRKEARSEDADQIPDTTNTHIAHMISLMQLECEYVCCSFLADCVSSSLLPSLPLSLPR